MKDEPCIAAGHDDVLRAECEINRFSGTIDLACAPRRPHRERGTHGAQAGLQHQADLGEHLGRHAREFGWSEWRQPRADNRLLARPLEPREICKPCPAIGCYPRRKPGRETLADPVQVAAAGRVLGAIAPRQRGEFLLADLTPQHWIRALESAIEHRPRVVAIHLHSSCRLEAVIDDAVRELVNRGFRLRARLTKRRSEAALQAGQRCGLRRRVHELSP